MSQSPRRKATPFLRRVFVAPVTAGALALTALLGAPAASAQQLPSIEEVQSQADQLSAEARQQLDNFVGQTREGAWNTRNQILQQLETVNPQAAAAIRPAVDAAVDAVFPGLIEQKNAEARAAREAADRAHAEEIARQEAEARAASERAEAERAANQFDRGSCPLDAKVCVDLDGKRSWLQGLNGEVTYVASAISSGMAGEETPRGTFYINRKVKDEISREFNNAPMPYSMYFTNSGHAFHEGSPAYESNGCIHLPHNDAVRFWTDVPVGSKVVIY
ncbi:MAG: L,D-transpeptidase [Corynebacterium flavescens]|nr:L,D-transpeptidase [Corynebacterium flavescens]